MRTARIAAIKFGIFALAMIVLSTGLVVVFGQYRTGSTNTYTALFADTSGLRDGQTVRVAGIRVGTVKKITLERDQRVTVSFDADSKILLTTGTKAAVRYLNLVGDRYLELIDGPGPMQKIAAGSQIPINKTVPALDLDLLVGGFKPVIQALNPKDVNNISTALLQLLQGEAGTLNALMSNTSSFSNTLADNDAVIQQLIDSLKTVLATLSKNGEQFSETVANLEQLVTGFARERDPIGAAIEALSNGTASVADLLVQGRAPLAGLIDQLSRVAPALEDGNERIDKALNKAPANYLKLGRLGAYGSFFQFYLCGVSIRVSDLSGDTVKLPWFKQTTGRCAP